MEPEEIVMSALLVCLAGTVVLVSILFAALRDMADSLRSTADSLETVADNMQMNGQQFEQLVAYFHRVEKQTRLQRVSELVDDEKARKQLLSELDEIQKEMAHETIGQKLKDFL